MPPPQRECMYNLIHWNVIRKGEFQEFDVMCMERGSKYLPSEKGFHIIKI